MFSVGTKIRIIDMMGEPEYTLYKDDKGQLFLSKQLHDDINVYKAEMTNLTIRDYK